MQTTTVVKDDTYYEQEEIKQEKSKKGRKDKENYYSESGKSLGYFYGDGSTALDINELAIKNGSLSKFSKGLHPNTEQKLFTARQSNWKWVDCCLSAPKDFSIVANLDEANKDVYEAIFDKAAKRAMKTMQKYAKRKIKNRVYSKDAQLVFAYFDHEIARPDAEFPDMQKHRHVLVSRFCVTKDGEVKSLDNHSLFVQQKLVGTVFRAELAKGLREHGFEIEPAKEMMEDEFTNKHTKVNAFKIKGITDEMRDCFSKRSKSINESAGPNATVLDRVNAAQNIKRKKVAHTVESLKNSWKTQALAHGLDSAYINSLKTHKDNTLQYAQLDSFLLKFCHKDGKILENKLLLKLAEYEQFTGINYSKNFNRLVKLKSVEGITRYEYKCNMNLKSATKLQSTFSRKCSIDNSFMQEKFNLFKKHVSFDFQDFPFISKTELNKIQATEKKSLKIRQ